MRYLLPLSLILSLSGAIAQANPALYDVLHWEGVPIDGLIKAPREHLMWCEEHPDNCRAYVERGPAFVEVSFTANGSSVGRENVRIMNEVNNTVNQRIWCARNGLPWRSFEELEPPDCGNNASFALAKQAALINHGFPARAVLLTIVETSNGQHVVVTVRTTKGDFILDDRLSEVIFWGDVPGYTYLKRQSYLSPRAWHSLKRATPRPYDS